jgi:hypothetical protein
VPIPTAPVRAMPTESAVTPPVSITRMTCIGGPTRESRRVGR